MFLGTKLNLWVKGAASRLATVTSSSFAITRSSSFQLGRVKKLWDSPTQPPARSVQTPGKPSHRCRGSNPAAWNPALAAPRPHPHRAAAPMQTGASSRGLEHTQSQAGQTTGRAAAASSPGFITALPAELTKHLHPVQGSWGRFTSQKHLPLSVPKKATKVVYKLW